MANLPPEIVLMCLTWLSLPELSSTHLVCKMWKRLVYSEVKRRVKAGLLSGKGHLIFEISPNRRAEVAKTQCLPLRNSSDFNQNSHWAKLGYLVFERQINNPCALLYLSIDVGVSQLVFHDVIGNRACK